jgi:hypothetical protein
MARHLGDVLALAAAVLLHATTASAQSGPRPQPKGPPESPPKAQGPPVSPPQSPPKVQGPPESPPIAQAPPQSPPNVQAPPQSPPKAQGPPESPPKAQAPPESPPKAQSPPESPPKAQGPKPKPKPMSVKCTESRMENPYCFDRNMDCPSYCPQSCYADCNTCKPVCDEHSIHLPTINVVSYLNKIVLNQRHLF